ncbi:MAG: VWA domain-containing protein [Clostridia bacterium]|nr:VWA domain-containing protein [Clostridia bacterium]
MINISFDNPWLLLLAIPVFGFIIAGYCIAIGKENRTKHIVASFVLHLVMAACIVLSTAGTVLTCVLTKTEVYVLADVSYSANANLDTVNGYVQKVKKGLPKNAEMGVICFGKDQQLVTEMGEKIVSVKEAQVDESATDIVSALEYASTLFSEDVIKRIVLITDGKQTGGEAAAELVNAVEKLYAQNVYVDAMYVNDNLSPNAKEVQISTASYMQSTYLNHETKAQVMVQTTYETPAVVSLYKDGVKVKDVAQRLTVGLNVVNFDLFTAARGTYDYEVRVQAAEDELSLNNAYGFTQTVSGEMRVLLISGNAADEASIETLYGDKATVDAYINTTDVPFTVEQLCKYYEIVISDFDVDTLEYDTTFLDSLNVVTQTYGKSLLTFGDMRIQDQDENETLTTFSGMLPVNYGNANQGAKFLSIVLDISSSMDGRGHFILAKHAVEQLMELLEFEKDYIAVTYFADKVYPFKGATTFTEEVKEEILDDLEVRETKHGTAIEEGLKVGYNEVVPYAQTIANKQVMLISDGLRFSGSDEDLGAVAAGYKSLGIATSTILTNSREVADIQDVEAEYNGLLLMKDIAADGGGKYYHAKTTAEIKKLILTEVAANLTESVVLNKPSTVILSRASDKSLQGVDTQSFAKINSYVNSTPKGGATTVLSTLYVNSENVSTEVPLYAYWKYGNGRVATFTSALSGDWSAAFRNQTGEKFLSNVFATNVPAQKVENPYLVDMVFDGLHATVSLTPAVVDLDAVATVEIVTPNGQSYTDEMVFYATGYTYRFSASELGKYTVRVNYSYANVSFPSEWTFHATYASEYDRFTTFDPAELYAALRNRGVVSEDGEITLVNDEKAASTYVVQCTVPLVMTAVLLFVIDVAVRKLKWADIKGLFKRKKKETGGGKQ